MRGLAPIVLCALAACAGEGPSTPPVEIVGLAGLESRVANRDGRPLLVNFWAIW